MRVSIAIFTVPGGCALRMLKEAGRRWLEFRLAIHSLFLRFFGHFVGHFTLVERIVVGILFDDDTGRAQGEEKDREEP